MPSPGEVLPASCTGPKPQAQPQHVPTTSPSLAQIAWAAPSPLGQSLHSHCELSREAQSGTAHEVRAEKVKPSALTCELTCCQVLCSCWPCGSCHLPSREDQPLLPAATTAVRHHPFCCPTPSLQLCFPFPGFPPSPEMIYPRTFWSDVGKSCHPHLSCGLTSPACFSQSLVSARERVERDLVGEPVVDRSVPKS